MCLPASGTISISQIRNEIFNNGCGPSSYSLGALAGYAGFPANPDAMSEFYNYCCSTTTTVASYAYGGTVSTYGSSTLACANQTCGRSYYLAAPVWAPGYTVYDDVALTTPFNGGGNWIAVATSSGYCSGGWAAIQVASNGAILNVISCSFTTTTTTAAPTTTTTSTTTSTTSTTSTTTAAPTTTTTTVASYVYAGTVSTYSTSATACANQTCGRDYYLAQPSWSPGYTVYNDSALTSTFNGGSNWIAVATSTTYCSGGWAAIQVNSSGVILDIISCSSFTTTTTSTTTSTSTTTTTTAAPGNCKDHQATATALMTWTDCCGIGQSQFLTVGDIFCAEVGTVTGNYINLNTPCIC